MNVKMIELPKDTKIDELEKISCPIGDELYWRGCYEPTTLDAYITKESIAHPAKMARRLCDRIFRHLEKLGLLKENNTVIDFMAGIGTTNIIASLRGYKTVSVELEPHFVKMQEGNKDLLERKMGRKIDWEIIQGDARKLSELLKERGCAGVVNPPYSDGHRVGRSYDLNELDKRRGYSNVGGFRDRYSDNPSNIGNLPDNTLVGVVSPPYAEAMDKRHDSPRTREIQRDKHWVTYYSKDKENIGNLCDAPLVGITSPPYEAQSGGHNIKGGHIDEGLLRRTSAGRIGDERYTANKDNISQQHDETYLLAMLKVYQEAFKCNISPLVVVTKNPTRNGVLRRLDLDTAKLLEMVGYQIYDYHRAVLFEERKQTTLDGEIMKIPKGRLSFFKRLSYRKGNVVARWEDIFIAIIPMSI